MTAFQLAIDSPAKAQATSSQRMTSDAPSVDRRSAPDRPDSVPPPEQACGPSQNPRSTPVW